MPQRLAKERGGGRGCGGFLITAVGYGKYNAEEKYRHRNCSSLKWSCACDQEAVLSKGDDGRGPGSGEALTGGKPKMRWRIH
ncbi:hypothetical protein IF1G_02160 [Cordyceps javanica]|uniref:Uncharacterized protein n=1 Tax=Cordyceps javanica TaxID=43265 RepID=A0A545VDZ1_9HYPO|nr:hypothetical protein IF1G_02160 [Cordyceps javanica]